MRYAVMIGALGIAGGCTGDDPSLGLRGASESECGEEGGIALIARDRRFVVCNEGQDGPEGPPGPTGPVGPVGPVGPSDFDAFGEYAGFVACSQNDTSAYTSARLYLFDGPLGLLRVDLLTLNENQSAFDVVIDGAVPTALFISPDLSGVLTVEMNPATERWRVLQDGAVVKDVPWTSALCTDARL